MDVRTAIETQRAVRHFTDRPIDAADLERIVDAGRLAPSSKNAQPWHFILCTDREHLHELSEVGNYAGHLAGAAAVVAFVTPVGWDEAERASIAFDLGQCVRNVMLAAWELGIGSVHAAVSDQRRTRELLGYPDDHRCDYLISLGYPAGSFDQARRIPQRARRPLEELVHHERWR